MDGFAEVVQMKSSSKHRKPRSLNACDPKEEQLTRNKGNMHKLTSELQLE